MKNYENNNGNKKLFLNLFFLFVNLIFFMLDVFGLFISSECV